MVWVITFEAPYAPIWDAGALHSLIYSATMAAEEAPVILRTSMEWAERVYKSPELIHLFVDYIRPDALLLDGMKEYPLTDGPLPEELEALFNDIMDDGSRGLYRQADS